MKCFKTLEKNGHLVQTPGFMVIIKAIFPDKTGILLCCQEDQHWRSRLLFFLLTTAGGLSGKLPLRKAGGFMGSGTLNARKVRSTCCRAVRVGPWTVGKWSVDCRKAGLVTLRKAGLCDCLESGLGTLRKRASVDCRKAGLSWTALKAVGFGGLSKAGFVTVRKRLGDSHGKLAL